MRARYGSMRLVVVLGILLGGCGGGAAEPPAFDAPQLAVLYPPPVSRATGPRITVRGTATNAASVTVNGVLARLDGDAWSADIALSPGTGALDVVLEGLDGSRLEDRCAIAYDGPHFEKPYDLVYDARRDRLVVADAFRRSLYAVDITTGERSLLFQSPDAPEPTHRFRLLKPLEIDEANDAVLVLREDGLIDSVDLETGEATRVVDGTEDYDIVQPRAIAFDPETRNLYVADRDYCTLHEIQLDTGAHRAASDFSSGGTDLHFRDIFWDSRRKHVVIAGTGRAGGAVIRVVMETGFRVDLGLGLAKPDALSYDPVADVAVLVDEPSLRVFGRASGTVSGRFEPEAADFGRFCSLAVKPGTTLCFAVDEVNDSIVAFDRADGTFTRIAGDRVGDGPALGAREGDGILDAAADPRRARTLVAVEYRERYAFSYPHWYYDTQYAVLAVGARTGERTVFAADESLLGKARVVAPRGEGPPIGRPVSVAVDDVAGRVLVLDAAHSAIVSLDPRTGDRRALAAGRDWREMAVDAERRRALVRTASRQLVEIDLDSGAAAILPHELPADADAMGVLPGTDRVFTSTAGGTAVQMIDLATGAYGSIPVDAGVRDLNADPDEGRILVLHATGIAAIDPPSATVRPIVDAEPGAFFPVEPARVCANGCLQIVTSGTPRDTRGMFAIDPDGGSVVVASKE